MQIWCHVLIVVFSHCNLVAVVNLLFETYKHAHINVYTVVFGFLKGSALQIIQNAVLTYLCHEVFT